jgi:hypothetical protein
MLTWAAVEAMAIAVWLLAASVHIVQWPSNGPVRIALTLPAWQLAALIVGAAVVGAAVALSPIHERWGRALRPFLLLWVLVVPYLPWLADRLPLLLVLAGPVRWLLVAIAALRALRTFQAVRGALSALLSMNRAAVLGAGLVVYAGLGVYTAWVTPIYGDEPHYLIISESLRRDGDIQIENNHARGDYRSFFDAELRPDYLQRGRDGTIYSIHAPGLPALLVPAYAIAGRLGAVAFIGLIAALAALAVFDLAEHVAGRAAAVLTWAAVCLTIPFVPHAWSIFPEMPGALLVAWGALWLWRDDDAAGPALWGLRGAALALLPWLHTKFIVILAVFSVGLGLRLMRRPARLVAVGLPIAVSCAVWLLSFYVMYGTWSPEAPYGAYARTYVLSRYIPHGLLGLLFDQKFGLLVYSPIYLFALPGAWTAVRVSGARLPAAVLLTSLAAFLGSTARLYMFWGGSSAPARFLVPVLPCLAPFVALAIARCTAAPARALLGVCFTIGLGATAVAVSLPRQLLFYSDAHGRARLLEWWQGAAPLALVAPTFTEPDWQTQLPVLGLWLGAATLSVLATAAAWRTLKARRDSGSGSRPAGSSWRVAGLAVATFLVTAGILTARPDASIREKTARRGDVEALSRFDGERLRVFDYAALTRPTAEGLRQLTTLRLRPDRTGDGQLAIGPFGLPAGEFDAEVWFSASRPRAGEVLIGESRAVLGRIEGALENPAVFAVNVPASTGNVMVRAADGQIAAAVTEVRLVPRSIVPPAGRDGHPVRMLESVSGWPGAYLVYTDDNAYPEMGTFWSRRTAATTVLVAPGGASRLVLTLSTGPNTGTVDVAVAGEQRAVPVVAGGEQVVAFPLPPGQRLVPITIRSSVEFRPADVDARARDMRGLGCRVQVVLE